MRYRMKDYSLAQLETVIRDMYKYFAGKDFSKMELAKFVDECVCVWSADICPGSAEDLHYCRVCFLKWMSPRAKYVNDITSRHLREYYEFLNKSNYKPGTVRHRRCFAKRVVTRARGMNLLNTDPMLGVKVKCKKAEDSSDKKPSMRNAELDLVYKYLEGEINNNHES